MNGVEIFWTKLPLSRMGWCKSCILFFFLAKIELASLKNLENMGCSGHVSFLPQRTSALSHSLPSIPTCIPHKHTMWLCGYWCIYALIYIHIYFYTRSVCVHLSCGYICVCTWNILLTSVDDWWFLFSWNVAKPTGRNKCGVLFFAAYKDIRFILHLF